MPQNQGGRESFQLSVTQHKLHTHIPRRKFALKNVHVMIFSLFHVTYNHTAANNTVRKQRKKLFSILFILPAPPWSPMKGFRIYLEGLTATTVCSVYGFFFPWLCKGCASVRRQRSKKGGRKKERGRREVKERDPHPASFLRALIEMYLYFLNFLVSA